MDMFVRAMAAMRREFRVVTGVKANWGKPVKAGEKVPAKKKPRRSAD